MKNLVLILFFIIPSCKADYTISDVPVGGSLVGVLFNDNTSEDFATPAPDSPDQADLNGIALNVSLREGDEATVIDDCFELEETIDVQEETLGGLYAKIINQVQHKYPALGAVMVSDVKRMHLGSFSFVELSGTKAVSSTLAEAGIIEDDYLGVVLERCIE